MYVWSFFLWWLLLLMLLLLMSSTSSSSVVSVCLFKLILKFHTCTHTHSHHTIAKSFFDYFVLMLSNDGFILIFLFVASNLVFRSYIPFLCMCTCVCVSVWKFASLDFFCCFRSVTEKNNKSTCLLVNSQFLFSFLRLLLFQRNSFFRIFKSLVRIEWYIWKSFEMFHWKCTWKRIFISQWFLHWLVYFSLLISYSN